MQSMTPTVRETRWGQARNPARVLLVFASEVHSTVVAGSARVAPIGLFFINGYLRARGHTTQILPVYPRDLAPTEEGASGVRERVVRAVSAILANDFATYRRLTYFFPHVTHQRRAFLGRIFAKLRRCKRVVVGLDEVIAQDTGLAQHAPELGVRIDARPWHKDMGGRAPT